MFPIPRIVRAKEVWKRVCTFNEEWVNSLIKIGESSDKVIAGEVGDYGGRAGKIAWMDFDMSREIWDEIALQVAQANDTFFNYDLDGFYDNFQYANYLEGDHFDWHIDRAGSPEQAPRKLSFTISLSHPDEYTGGHFEVMYAPKPDFIDLACGEMILFDAMMCHRVTKVTRGSRKTLVGWACGPALK